MPAEVLADIEARLRKLEPIASKYRRIGTLNEQFASGSQWGAVSLNGGASPVLVQDDWSVGLPRVWSNRAGGLLQTWCALLSGDLPTAAARPASDDPSNSYRADISNKILTYLRQKLNTAEKVSKVVRYGGQHGTSGLKVTFDTEADELKWDVLTIFGYVRDPTADYREAEWVIFRTRISVNEAKKRLKAAKLRTDPPITKDPNSHGEETEGVLLLELYEKPSEEYPEGRYAAVIGNDVVTEMANPFFFMVKGKKTYILPFFLMTVRDQRDSSYGATPFTDVVPLQRSLNETIAMHLMRQRMGQPALIIPAEMAAAYSPLTSATIPVPMGQEERAKIIRFTEPPAVDSNLETSLTLFVNEMQAVIGLNDTSAGDAQRAQSGAAIDSLLALDKEKNADATTSMKAMLLDAFKFSLLCVAALYSDEKKQEIADETKAAVDMFNEEDVGGVDVQLQIASESSDLTSGQGRTASSGLAKQRAQQVVNDYLAGGDVLGDTTGVDFTALRNAIDEAKALALQSGNHDEWLALFRLQDEADKLGAQQPPDPSAPPAPDPDAVNPGAVVDGPPAGA